MVATASSVFCLPRSPPPSCPPPPPPVSMFFPGLSDDAPLEPPISAQLRAHLEFAGLSDAGWMLGAQLGIRTWRSLLQLPTVELDLCCVRLACAGFGPGHAAALRALHNVGNGVDLQPGAHHGTGAAEPGASGAHSSTEVLLAKVTQTRSRLEALQLSVGMEMLGPGHFPGCSVVVQECIHMRTALDTLAAQALSDEASGAGPTQECQVVEKLAALALRSCEDAGAALAARPQGSAEATEQAGQMLALRSVTHELLVGVCARALPIEALRAKGISPSLRERLNAACGFDLGLQQHQELNSRVGKAKYHLFTPNKQWGGKKRQTASRAGVTIPAGTASSSDMAAPAPTEEMASGEWVEVPAEEGDFAQEEEDDEAVKALYLSI